MPPHPPTHKITHRVVSSWTFAALPKMPNVSLMESWNICTKSIFSWMFLARHKVHEVMIKQGNAFCLQNLGACCGLFRIVCWQRCFLSPAPPVVLSTYGWLASSYMPGLSWEAEAYMAQWKPLTRTVLLSIQVSPSSTSSHFSKDEVNLEGRLWVSPPSWPRLLPFPAEDYTLGLAGKTPSTFPKPAVVRSWTCAFVFLILLRAARHVFWFPFVLSY